MSTVNKESVLGQFLDTCNNQFSDRVDEINTLLSSFLEQVRPDELLNVPNYGRMRKITLLHLFTRHPGINYELLLQGKSIDCNIIDDSKDTPLHYACWYGNEKAVKLLLEHRADPNMFNNLAQTPLINLIRDRMLNNTTKILILLLEHGASVDVKSKSISIILYITRLCLEYNEPDSQNRALLVFKQVLNTSHNVNATDSIGGTPLHLACKAGNMTFVKTLLDAGCRYDQRDNNGKLPIDVIHDAEKKQKFSEMIDYLELR